MIDKQALLAFLDDKANARDVSKTSGLVISAIYSGLAARIRAGVFDEEDKDG